MDSHVRFRISDLEMGWLFWTLWWAYFNYSGPHKSRREEETIRVIQCAQITIPCWLWRGEGSHAPRSPLETGKPRKWILTPRLWLWSSELQNHKRIDLCGCKPWHLCRQSRHRAPMQLHICEQEVSSPGAVVLRCCWFRATSLLFKTLPWLTALPVFPSMQESSTVKVNKITTKKGTINH